MKILVVSRYKPNIAKHVLPFVEEQYTSLLDVGCKAELFLLQGNYWRQWNTLRAKIREFQPDIIHAHYGLSCLLANLTTRHVPVVSTYHGSDINLPKVRPFSKMAMRLSAWNIFVSKRNMALAGAEKSKKCSLVPCGVALSDDQLQTREEGRKKIGWSTEEKKVLFTGAFDNEVKNPELAKQAINELRNGGVNAELVELKGYTRLQVNTLICAVDCLLMTSKTEGSPQVVKEAMACGCPIVSVDVGDVAERIDGVDGCYLVPSRDPHEIAEALKKTLLLKGRTAGRNRIIKMGLTNEQVAKRIIEIYEKVIRK